MLDDRDPHGWTLKALREAGSTLLAEFYGLDEDDLAWRPGEDDWSLKETAAHLRDNEELALAQLRALTEDSRPPLPAWDVELLPLERDYRADDLEQALASFRALRRETTYLLWSLTEHDWERAGVHPYRGSVTLAQIAHDLAQHDLEHLWQVRRLKDQLAQAALARQED